MYDNQVAIRLTLSDFCKKRNESVNRLTEFFNLQDAIESDLKTFYAYGMPKSAQTHGNLPQAIKEIDRMFWQQAMAHTGLT